MKSSGGSIGNKYLKKGEGERQLGKELMLHGNCLFIMCVCRDDRLNVISEVMDSLDINDESSTKSFRTYYEVKSSEDKK